MPQVASAYPPTRHPLPLQGASRVRMVSPGRLKNLMELSTMVIMAGILLAVVAQMHTETVEATFRGPARFLAVALGIAMAVEGRAGLRNLVRVDLFMLAVLYLLTFFEFLLPQEVRLNDLVSLDSASTAAKATLLGFAGITLGRHAFPPKRPLAAEMTFQVSPRATMMLFLGCAFFGYLYMLRAVNFDIFELIYQVGQPRFTQPWTRGRLGGISTLLNEVGLLKYLLPPLAASIFAQGKRFSLIQKGIALAILSLLFYESFAGGTRNVFLTHVITFTVTYALLMKRLTLMRLIALAAPMLTVSWFAIFYLPEIRTVGLENFELETARTETLAVDYNLYNIAQLNQVFPDLVPYLGMEIPFTAVIRPIPRALWSGKPEGLSISIEQALGVTGLTLSATFVGEFWMAGGYLAIILAALALGAVAGRWNRVGAAADSNMKLILFAAGFFPAGICMRSFMSAAPPILPVIALALILRYWVSRRSNG